MEAMASGLFQLLAGCNRHCVLIIQPSRAESESESISVSVSVSEPETQTFSLG